MRGLRQLRAPELPLTGAGRRAGRGQPLAVRGLPNLRPMPHFPRADVPRGLRRLRQGLPPRLPRPAPRAPPQGAVALQAMPRRPRQGSRQVRQELQVSTSV